MEMHQVRYFRALCEELNFSRAANRCKVSQPSLSRAISHLEAEFGGPLFHRERQNTHLTEPGRVVKPYLDQVYEQATMALGVCGYGPCGLQETGRSRGGLCGHTLLGFL